MMRILLIFVSFSCAAILASPVDVTQSKEIEVKTDLSSSLISDVEAEADSDDIARSKKQIELPKTICHQIQGVDGNSFLHCGQEPAPAATQLTNTFLPAPAQFQQHFAPVSPNNQPDGNFMKPGNYFNPPQQNYQYNQQQFVPQSNYNDARQSAATLEKAKTEMAKKVTAEQRAKSAYENQMINNYYQQQNQNYGNFRASAPESFASNVPANLPDSQAQARAAYENAQMQAQAFAAYENERAAFENEARFAPGLPPPPPPPVHVPEQPKVSCGSNLLLSCTPSVQSVPCQAAHVHHESPKPEMSYYRSSYQFQQPIINSYDYARNAPTYNPQHYGQEAKSFDENSKNAQN
ncbi:hypothetical protein PVAND_016537 [Polypedilum vanderplanki]|uniref:Uncharacterized protein n=1 Tax=Polypedilum vanderplanki TaxID=319348 RepID=A0A9J6BFD1_POLVA|nr:hypothetical protein PVAND_016537 [Polypedilum vanderplanki]